MSQDAWEAAIRRMDKIHGPTCPECPPDYETTLHAMREYINFDTDDQQPISEKLIRGRMAGSGHSHTFFAGGKGKIEIDACPSIQRKYAIDLLVYEDKVTQRSALNNMIEFYVPSAFPFFVDIDWKTNREIDDIEALHLEYFKLVHQEACRFFPSADSKTTGMIVCGRPMVICKDTGKETYGYHLHFPRLIVNWEQALTIREAMVAALVRTYYERDVAAGEEPWNQVLDPCVYHRNGHGLRLIGSFKMKTCKIHDKGAVCRKQRYQVDTAGQPVTYWPMLACDGDGTINEALQRVIDQTFPVVHGQRGPARLFSPKELRVIAQDKNAADAVAYVQRVMELVSLTSVRMLCEITPGFVVYDGAPRRVRLPRRERETEDKHCTRETKRHKITGHRTVLSVRTAQQPVTRGREELVRLVQQHLRSLCKGNGVPIWPRLVVSEIFRGSVRQSKSLGTNLLVAVVGEGANFCMNLASKSSSRVRGRDHNSNRIYFIVSSKPPYVQQRCHSANPASNGRFAAPGKPPIQCTAFTSACTGCIHGCRPVAALISAIEAQGARDESDTPLFGGPNLHVADTAGTEPSQVALESIRRHMFA